ncbi:hypothetical protein [Corynebacterium sp. TAE3-ERU16]|uniref:hypothetical protein n=1 Tax=Corynebacterium sp. TAE3-ERU16 TaxID=2849493 RepID=UPI001C4729C2|nr:hypothetical protein [Corynebacterium sp. TAE3-ERU16]MBV7292586.1 hypothetical protein [Corynebacterium sp. TAE3-ERU16]
MRRIPRPSASRSRPRGAPSPTTLSRTLPAGGDTFAAGEDAESTATVDTDGARVEDTVSFYSGDVLPDTAEPDPDMKATALRHTFTTPGKVTVHAVSSGREVRTGDVTTATYTYAPASGTHRGTPRHRGPRPGGGDGASADGVGAVLQKLSGSLGNTSFTDFFSGIISAIRALSTGFGKRRFSLP